MTHASEMTHANKNMICPSRDSNIEANGFHAFSTLQNKQVILEKYRSQHLFDDIFIKEKTKKALRSSMLSSPNTLRTKYKIYVKYSFHGKLWCIKYLM